MRTERIRSVIPACQTVETARTVLAQGTQVNRPVALAIPGKAGYEIVLTEDGRTAADPAGTRE